MERARTTQRMAEIFIGYKPNWVKEKPRENLERFASAQVASHQLHQSVEQLEFSYPGA